MAEPTASQIAYQRFLASLEESYPIVRVSRVRCPSCRTVAQGRAQHTDLFDLPYELPERLSPAERRKIERTAPSVQRRKCHNCQTIYVAFVD